VPVGQLAGDEAACAALAAALPAAAGWEGPPPGWGVEPLPGPALLVAADPSGIHAALAALAARER
jgi:hypothetical protein